MADYIDREELLKHCYFHHFIGGSNTMVYIDPDPKRYVSVDDIKNAPAADVVPVVHGLWIKEECRDVFDRKHTLYKCSNCNKRNIVPPMASAFCARCGAKMYEVSE